MEMKPQELRERILEDLGSTNEILDEESGPIIPIDHHFHVRGIGAVALGVVRKGTIRKYDKLKLFPADQDLLIRSIQTHDKDVSDAITGERVGLALKGPSVEDLDRGHIIAHENSGVRSSKVIHLDLSTVPYWKKDITRDMVVHLCSMMQMRPGRITEVGATQGLGERKGSESSAGREIHLRLTVELERHYCYHPQMKIIVAHLEGGSLRIIGYASPMED